jgi:hypothetical protein
VKPDAITSFKSRDQTISIEYILNLNIKYGKKEYVLSQPITILHGVPEKAIPAPQYNQQQNMRKTVPIQQSQPLQPAQQP